MKHIFKSKMGASNTAIIVSIIILLLVYAVSQIPVENFIEDSEPVSNKNKSSVIDTRDFNILVSDENKDLEEIIAKYAKSKGYHVKLNYTGTLDIMNQVNKGIEYDALWTSNSIWNYMIDSSVASVKDAKSTCITPIVFGIKKSKAEELGFVNNTVYTKDLMEAISNGKLKFIMSNPTTTNSGASAYLGMLYTLAGNPEVLTEDILENEEVRASLKAFFSGVERSSGTEDFLEQAFLNGDYEAVFTYESSIIKLNQELERQGKEPLYAIYPVDGVSICNNPFAYIDHKDDEKRAVFLDIQAYLLSSEGQALLEQKARRTWFGGINENVDQAVFNPKWGIDTTKYITPVKFPSAEVIKKALYAYQSGLRKPIHIVFCLDYSGSMVGEGIEELRNAMKYILTEEAEKDNIQFFEDDVIDVLPFSSDVLDKWSTQNGSQTQVLLQRINNKEPYGGTAIYKVASSAIDILSKEDTGVYNVSVVLMTDGIGNVGKKRDFTDVYNRIGGQIPVYSIMFGDADSEQLEEIAHITNGKVFDGKSDLVGAFKEVRGYN